jgi:hypothetical protein
MQSVMPSTANSAVNSSLGFLSSLYPQTLTVFQVAEITRESIQTIRNRLSSGTYHIPSFKVGRKRLFRLVDLIEFLDQQYLEDASHPSHRRPKRGRPTKAEQIARKRQIPSQVDSGTLLNEVRS